MIIDKLVHIFVFCADEAITHFTEALRINPNFADARHNLRRALQRQGKFDGATTDATQIDPNSSD
ncbi:hypothetical protein ES703_83782 [subsurface metagenome]